MFSCKNRCWYSRKRATFCRNLAKNWQGFWQNDLRVDPRERQAGHRGGRERPLVLRDVDEVPGPVAGGLAKLGKLANFANFWRARSRLYQNEILQENMRLTAFFKRNKICILLHRCNHKHFCKKSVWKISNFRENSAKKKKKIASVAKFAKFCQISKTSAR